MANAKALVFGGFFSKFRSENWKKRNKNTK